MSQVVLPKGFKPVKVIPAQEQKPAGIQLPAGFQPVSVERVSSTFTPLSTETPVGVPGPVEAMSPLGQSTSAAKAVWQPTTIEGGLPGPPRPVIIPETTGERAETVMQEAISPASRQMYQREQERRLPPAQSEFGKGFATGMLGIDSAIGSGLEITGVDALKAQGGFMRETSQQLRQSVKAEIDTLQNIKGPVDFAKWFSFQLGNAVPSASAALTGSAVGGATAGVAGSVAGAGAISYLLNSGEVYANLREQGIDAPGAALIAGIPMAMLDIIVPVKVMNQVVWKPVVKSATKEFGKDVAIEAGTEGAQELIGVVAEALSGGKARVFSGETVSRVVNATAGGAVGGIGFGVLGAGGGQSQIQATPEKEAPPIANPPTPPAIPPEIVAPEEPAKPPQPTVTVEPPKPAAPLPPPPSAPPVPPTPPVPPAPAVPSPPASIPATTVPPGAQHRVDIIPFGGPVRIAKPQPVPGVADWHANNNNLVRYYKLDPSTNTAAAVITKDLNSGKWKWISPEGEVILMNNLQMERTLPYLLGYQKLEQRPNWTRVGDVYYYKLDPATGAFQAIRHADNSMIQSNYGENLSYDILAAEDFIQQREKLPSEFQRGIILATYDNSTPQNQTAAATPFFIEDAPSRYLNTPQAPVSLPDGGEALVLSPASSSQARTSLEGPAIQTPDGPTSKLDLTTLSPSRLASDPVVIEGLTILNNRLQKMRSILQNIDAGTSVIRAQIKRAAEAVHKVALLVDEEDIYGRFSLAPYGRGVLGIAFLPNTHSAKQFNTNKLATVVERTIDLIDTFFHEFTHAIVLAHGKIPGENSSFDQVMAEIINEVVTADPDFGHELQEELINYYAGKAGTAGRTNATGTVLNKKFLEFDKRHGKQPAKSATVGVPSSGAGGQPAKSRRKTGSRRVGPASGVLRGGIEAGEGGGEADRYGEGPRDDGKSAQERITQEFIDRGDFSAASPDYINAILDDRKKTREQKGIVAPLRPEGTPTTAAMNPPPGSRWYADRGAIPGEPQYFLDGEGLDASAAIIEEELPGKGHSVYTAVDADGNVIGTFNSPGEAAAAAERYVEPNASDMAEVRGLVEAIRKNTTAVPEAVEAVEEGHIRFFRLLRKLEALHQMKDHFPNFIPFQQYLAVVRKFWYDKTQINLRADQTLKQLYKLGVAGQSKVFKLHLWAQEESLKLKRRLTPAEIAAQAQRFGLRQQDLDGFNLVQKDFDDTLSMLEKAAIDEANRLYGVLAGPMIKQIQADFDELRNRNYFPTSRFGRHGVVVKATKAMTWNGKSFRKGQVVYFETTEGYLGGEMGAEKYQRQLKEELDKKFANLPVEVTSRYLQDAERAFFGLPPSLIDLLIKTVKNPGLTQAQILEIKQLGARLVPGRGFVKHMIRKRGIAGFSGEGKRAYSDYMQHVATHIAKMKNRLDFEKAIEGIKSGPGWTRPQLDRDYLLDTITKHYSYLLNPGNEHAMLRSLVFPWFFALSYKQAVMNLTQIPIFWGPMMAKQLGIKGMAPGKSDAITGFYIMKAMKTVGGIFSLDNSVNILNWNWKTQAPQLDAEISAMWKVGMEEGWLDESFASEAAAATQAQTVLSKLPGVAELNLDYRIRRLIEASTRHFKLSEDFNRLACSHATYEIARKHMGMTQEEAISYTRDVIADTMGEYARWDRPELMRGGWKPAIFVFKMFLQMALRFVGTNKGGVRFWMALLALAGWKGVPFANELVNLLDLFGTGAKEILGWKNPRVDIKKYIGDLVNTIGLNPDLVANGLARYGFGLSLLPGMPNMDYSASIQLGKVLPVEPIAQSLLGAIPAKEAALQAVSDLMGVGISTGMNATVSLMDPRASKRVTWAYPRVFRDIMRANQWLKRERVLDAKGDPLVDIDPADPYDQATLIGKSIMYGTLGLPTEMNQNMEVLLHQRMIQNYYTVRRENLLTRWANAVANKEDREELAAAKKEYIEFQKTAPPAFRMTTQEVRESLLTRIKGQRLDALGLSKQRRYTNMLKDIRESHRLLGAAPTKPPGGEPNGQK